MGYVSLPLGVTAEELQEEALDTLVASIPGFLPSDSHLETFMALVAARMNAETRNVATTVGDNIFKTFGESLVEVPPVAAAYATVESTWVMVDDAGYTVEPGTQVGLRLTGDEVVPFTVLDGFTVAPGDTTALAVVLQAVEAGVAANDIPAGPIELIDSLAFVDLDLTVTDDVTSGGIDAETDDQYLARLVSELRLLAPRPILPDEFAIFSRRITGVYRALAIDGYNPVGGTYDNERMVTLALVDTEGAAVSAPIKTAVETYLESVREVNFVVNVIDPTYTSIDVAFTITVLDDYVPAEVVTAAEEAVTEFLDPANWGGGADNPPTWRPSDDTVRLGEMYHVIYKTPGVDDVTALTINGGTVDVALAGVAPLPQPDDIVGSV